MPDDPRYAEQWALSKIDAPSAWTISKGSGAKIAVIDTGFSTTHQDLSGHMTTGWNCVGTNSVSPVGENLPDHGTWVAGVAAAVTDNGVGIAGVGWQSTILPLRYRDDSGEFCGDLTLVDRAISEGAAVINMSYSYENPNPVLCDKLKEAWNTGLIGVASVGNDNSSAPLDPAACSHVMAVAASTQSDSRRFDSNFGDWVTLAAPGDNILTTVSGDQYGSGGGTSFAAPHVAGVAALLRAVGMSNCGAWKSMVENADPITWQGGSGRLDAGAALANREPCITHPNGALLKDFRTDHTTNYVITADAKRRVPSLPIRDSWDYSSDEIIKVSDIELEQYPAGAQEIGFRPGMLIRVGGPIYLITNDGDWLRGDKRKIANMGVLNTCFTGLSWVEVSSGDASVHATGANITGCSPTHPDGTVVKGSGTTIYVLDGGDKRRVISQAALDSWDFSPDIVTISDPELDGYTVGTDIGFRPGNLIQDPLGRIDFVTNDPDVALGPRRHVVSVNALDRCFPTNQWISASAADMAAHPETTPLTCSLTHPNGTFVKGSGTTNYVLEDENKRPVPSLAIRDSWITASERVLISDDELDGYTTGTQLGFRPGMLIRVDGPIYLITNDADWLRGDKRKIADTGVLNSCFAGLSWVEVTSGDASVHSTGADITGCDPSHPSGTVIKGSGTAIYVVESDILKRKINSQAMVDSWDFGPDIVSVSDSELDRYFPSQDVGFRPGTLLFDSFAVFHFVTNDGDVGRGGERKLVNWMTVNCLFEDYPNLLATAAELATHPSGLDIDVRAC